MRVIGFVLIAISIIGTMLAFTFADTYIPQLGLIRNMSQTRIFKVDSTVEVQCREPSPIRSTFRAPPTRGSTNANGCPLHPADWNPGATGQRTVTSDGIPLGIALATTGIVGLTGVGLAVFGRRPD